MLVSRKTYCEALLNMLDLDRTKLAKVERCAVEGIQIIWGQVRRTENETCELLWGTKILWYQNDVGIDWCYALVVYRKYRICRLSLGIGGFAYGCVSFSLVFGTSVYFNLFLCIPIPTDDGWTGRRSNLRVGFWNLDRRKTCVRVSISHKSIKACPWRPSYHSTTLSFLRCVRRGGNANRNCAASRFVK